MLDHLLDLAGLADFLGVSESTADRLRRKDGLPFVNITPSGERAPRKRIIRFDPLDVLEWAKSRRDEER